MKELLTTLIIVLLFFIVKGQEVAPIIPEVIPPGPTAAELGRYGLVPVNMHTGNTNVSIPLYDFKTKDLSIPISLTYNSSAIHVDEVASWVGMHWSLNAGGVITRIVRDQPDRPGGMPYPEDFSMNDAMSIQYVQYIAQTPEAEDTEPDIFTYNFLGYSGKLVFDRDGTPVTIPRNDLVFEGHFDNDFWNGFIVTTPDGIKYSFDEVELTTITGSGEGTYNVPTAWYLTKIVHPLGGIVRLTYGQDNYGYPLSISSTSTVPTNAPYCYTGQACPGASTDATLSHISMNGKMLTSITSVGYGSVTFQAATGRSDIEAGHNLSSITVKDTQGNTLKSFVFDYVFSNNTGFSNPLAIAYDQFVIHRMYLTNVREKDKLGNDVRGYVMEYDDINSLPARLSNASDHWGYYNGANNSNQFPETNTVFDHQGQLAFQEYNANRQPNSTHAKKGLLKKITYPTGGSSEFIYEGNTYYGSHQIYPAKSPSYMQVSGVEEQYEDIVSSTTITSGVDQYVKLYIACNYKYGYSSTLGHGKWIVYNQQGNSVDAGYIEVGESRTEYVHLLGGQQYTIVVIAEGPPPDVMWTNNTITTLNFQHYATAPQTVTENIQTGGIRIASIINHDPVSENDDIINYHYARHDQLTQSSGKKMGEDPDYITRYSLGQTCNPGVSCSTMLCTYVALHSSGMNNLFRQNGNNIYYEYVTIIRGTDIEAGLEEHEFIVSPDVQGMLVWGNDDIPGTPMSNINWDNGLEKAIRYFKKDGTNTLLLKEVVNEYTKDSRYHVEIPGLSFRRKYWPGCHTETQPAIFHCDASNINKKSQIYRCITNHNHWLVIPLFSGKITCKAPGNSMQWIDASFHPCFGHAIGETVYLPLNISFVDAVEYKNISDWFYLSKQLLTTYDENGLNPSIQVTNYFYDNDTHTQLARQVTTSSTGKSMETQYKYARDYVPVSGDAMELMAGYSLNMVAMPIEQIQKVNGQVIAASATDYDVYPVYENGNIVNEFIAPKDIYRYETNSPGAGFNESLDGKTFGSYTKKATIHNYDNNGNILEVSKEGDVPNAYIWGYGKQFPIAKVENATNASASAQFPSTNNGSAQITEYVGYTPILPSFEINSSQQLSVTLGLQGAGTSLPTSPLVNLSLKRADGTTVHSINGIWGQHTSSISVGPGTYQWYYSTGDVSFSPPDYTSIYLTLSNSYSASRTGSRIFHTSFEEDGNYTAVSYTGEKSFQGQYTVYLPAQNGSYKLTYMKWNSGLQEWEPFTNDISVTSGTVQSFTIGSSLTIIDEVRLYPADAVMTTYTYTPMIGMTSQTDQNNVTTYFEYDSFNRLKLIRDKDNNILQTYEYHYKGETQAGN